LITESFLLSKIL